jgi:hypothetical protein
MLTNLLGGLFRKRCPLCKAEIQRGGEGVVRRLGKLFCSQSHADTYERNLYQALHDLHRQHASRHGGHALLLVTSSLDCDASGASQGGTEGRVCCGTWFALRSITSSLCT